MLTIDLAEKVFLSETLKLYYSELSDGLVTCLFMALKSPFSTVIALELDVDNLFLDKDTSKALTALAEHLNHADNKITQLTLTCDDQLIESNMEILVKALENKACKIRHLNFKECGFTDAAGKVLERGLKNKDCQLESLYFSVWDLDWDLPIEDTAVEAVSSALRTKGCHLKELCFFGFKLSDIQLDVLISGVQSEVCGLRVLSLPCMLGSEEKVKPLIQSFSHKDSKIDSFTPPFSPKSVTMVGALYDTILKADCALTEVDLAGHDLSDGEVRGLAESQFIRKLKGYPDLVLKLGTEEKEVYRSHMKELVAFRNACKEVSLLSMIQPPRQNLTMGIVGEICAFLGNNPTQAVVDGITASMEFMLSRERARQVPDKPAARKRMRR